MISVIILPFERFKVRFFLSYPFAQAFSIGVRQAAVFYGFGGLFYIIFKTDKFHLDSAALVGDCCYDR